MQTEKKTASGRASAASKKPAAVTSSAKPRRKTPVAARTSGPRPGIPPEERRRLIAQEAYLKAERRGFSGGSPEQDWLEAEAEIDGMLLKRIREGA